jgi:hypothetical protein
MSQTIISVSVIFGLQRTAGPYRCAITGSRAFHLMTSSVQGEQGGRHFEVLVLMVVK